jgi:vacuolar-type H+-ATPase subunit I/STV1
MNFIKSNFFTILKVALAVFVIYWLMCVLTPSIKMSSESKAIIDSLNNHIIEVQKKQDSLTQNIVKYNEEIKEVDKVISNIKNEKTIIKEFYHEKIISVDTFNMSDIDKFFTNRYGQY